MDLATCLDAMPGDDVPADIADRCDPATRVCCALSDLECLGFEDAAGMGV